MTATLDDIIDIVSTEGGIDPEKLSPDVTLADLDISSLDLASIVFEVEDRCHVEIEPGDIPPDTTLRALLDHVNSLPKK